ncbi:MAG: GNAT family N-acetyltransferase [Bacteroidota bacterium]
MEKIRVSLNDPLLTATTYLSLVQRVWPGEYDVERTKQALSRTLNISAWKGERLIGNVRILTDGYYFGTIPEILVDPDFQRGGIGRKLMEKAWEESPTSLFLGAQPGKEGFFEQMGYERSLVSFQRKKKRL